MVTTYGVEGVVFFEAFFEYSGLVFGESKFFPCGFSVFLVADSAGTGSVHVVFFAVRFFSLATFSTHARDGAVRRRNSRFLLGVHGGR